jgi:hypothetical protein
MRHGFLSLSLLIATAVIGAEAQRSFDEYGRPVEMRGRLKLYLDVGEDIELREHVIRTIDKATSPIPITWVSKANEADLLLAYAAWQEREGDDTFAKLFAFMLTPEGKSRLLWSGKDRKMSIAVLTPATSTILARRFAAAFVEAQKQ